MIGWSPLAMIAAGSRLTDVCVDLSPCRVERAGALIGARAHASQRAFFGHYMIVAALLLVAAALPAWAQETCSAAFAQWVKLSESHISKPTGTPSADQGSRGPCIAGEPQRQELLRALASVRDRCQASTATDAETEHVRMMIGINESFIGSVALCPSEASHKEVAKAEGPPATPRARPRQCLQVSRVATNRHAVINGRCNGTTVLAVIETQAPSGTISCKAYAVETRIAVQGKDPLTLNFECAVDQKKCTRERVAAMFPECDW